MLCVSENMMNQSKESGKMEFHAIMLMLREQGNPLHLHSCPKVETVVVFSVCCLATNYHLFVCSLVETHTQTAALPAVIPIVSLKWCSLFLFGLSWTRFLPNRVHFIGRRALLRMFHSPSQIINWRMQLGRRSARPIPVVTGPFKPLGSRTRFTLSARCCSSLLIGRTLEGVSGPRWWMADAVQRYRLNLLDDGDLSLLSSHTPTIIVCCLSLCLSLSLAHTHCDIEIEIESLNDWLYRECFFVCVCVCVWVCMRACMYT